MQKNKMYSNELKDVVLKIINKNETVSFLSNELNIPKSTIYRWVKSYNKNDHPIDIECKTTHLKIKFRS